MEISVITTCFNKEKYIEETILSVVNSDFNDFEYIIIDDCSTDKSWDIISKYRNHSKIKIFRNTENLGDYPTRNVAGKNASGKYIKYVDGDDLITENCLSNFYSLLESHPSVALALGKRELTFDGSFKIFNPYASFMEHFFGSPFFINAPTSSMIKRSVFEEMGGFLEEKHMGDTDLWFRIGLKYDILKCDAKVKWRKVEGQESSISSKSYLVTKKRKELAEMYLMKSSLSDNEKKRALKRNNLSYFKGKVIKEIFKGNIKLGFNNLSIINWSKLLLL